MNLEAMEGEYMHMMNDFYSLTGCKNERPPSDGNLEGQNTLKYPVK